MLKLPFHTSDDARSPSGVSLFSTLFFRFYNPKPGNYSTADYIFVAKQLLERVRELKLTLCLHFIVFEKRFDSTELNVMLQAALKEGIDECQLKAM